MGHPENLLIFLKILCEGPGAVAACRGRHNLPHGPTAAPGLARQGWVFLRVHDAPENKKAAVCAAASIF